MGNDRTERERDVRQDVLDAVVPLLTLEERWNTRLTEYSVSSDGIHDRT